MSGEIFQTHKIDGSDSLCVCILQFNTDLSGFKNLTGICHAVTCGVMCFYFRAIMIQNNKITSTTDNTMSNAHETFMRRAIQLSIENVKSGKGGPFAAVIVKDGKIIAEGTNLVTSANDPTAHAEVTAIRNACEILGDFQLTGCTVYTSCEPCPMCLGAIYWARPDAVFYGNTKRDAADIGFDDSFIYEELDKPLEARSVPMKQLMPDEALAGFRAWTEKTDKISY